MGATVTATEDPKAAQCPNSVSIPIPVTVAADPKLARLIQDGTFASHLILAERNRDGYSNAASKFIGRPQLSYSKSAHADRVNGCARVIATALITRNEQLASEALRSAGILAVSKAAELLDSNRKIRQLTRRIAQLRKQGAKKLKINQGEAARARLSSELEPSTLAPESDAPIPHSSLTRFSRTKLKQWAKQVPKSALEIMSVAKVAKELLAWRTLADILHLEPDSLAFPDAMAKAFLAQGTKKERCRAQRAATRNQSRAEEHGQREKQPGPRRTPALLEDSHGLQQTPSCSGRSTPEALGTCGICFDVHPEHDLYSFHAPCEASFRACQPCGRRFFLARATDGGLGRLSCPAQLCRQKNDPKLALDVACLAQRESLSQFLTPDELYPFDVLSLRLTLMRIPDIRVCPGATCGAAFALPAGASRLAGVATEPASAPSDQSPTVAIGTPRPCRDVSCPECFVEFCSDCQDVPHAGTCLEALSRRSAAVFGTSSQGEDGPECTTTRWFADVKHCPLCRVMVQRNGGCNHMSCTQCGTQFCWDCSSFYGNCKCAGSQQAWGPDGQAPWGPGGPHWQQPWADTV